MSGASRRPELLRITTAADSVKWRMGCLCQSVELFLHGRRNFPPAFGSFLLVLLLPSSYYLYTFTYGAPYSKVPLHAQEPVIAASTCPSSITITAIPLHRHCPRRAANLLQFQEPCTLMTLAQPTVLLLLLPLLFPPRQTPSRRHGSAIGQSLSRG